MNKRVLIISPYFPPLNAADMQRVRMSLPYFNEFGWEAEIVTVDPAYADLPHDPLLLQSLPAGLKIHQVRALDKKWTSKLGLGSIALRSLRDYRRKVNRLLRDGRFDLVYFSTTQFPVCILGAYWKKRFHVPYVIDMQDPWHSDYYRDKPRAQQPPKYWFSYRLNRYLEPRALRAAGGLISVSEKYITDLRSRYPELRRIPAEVITFGAFAPDMLIAAANSEQFERLTDPATRNIVYVGRGGADMHSAAAVLFRALSRGLSEDPALFRQLRVYFAGTSYAPAGQGKPSLLPLANAYGLGHCVTELTDRISYYHTLVTLQQADALFIPGSDDPAYTASKLYPYLLTGKPLLAVFHPQSPAIAVLREYGVAEVYGYDTQPPGALTDFLRKAAGGQLPAPAYRQAAIEKYSARSMTERQCQLFDQVIHGKN